MKSKHYPISGFAFVCSCISVNIIHLLQKICWSRTFMHIYNNVTEMVQHFRIMTKYEKQASTYIIKKLRTILLSWWKIVKFQNNDIVHNTAQEMFWFSRFLKDMTVIFHSGVLFDDFEWECWAMKTPFWWYFYLFHGRLNLEQGFYVCCSQNAFSEISLVCIVITTIKIVFMLLLRLPLT